MPFLIMRKQIISVMYWGGFTKSHKIADDINYIRSMASKNADLKISVISSENQIPVNDITHFHLDCPISNQPNLINILLGHIGDWDVTFMTFDGVKPVKHFDVTLWSMVGAFEIGQTNFKICDLNGIKTKYNYHNSIPFVGRTHYEKNKEYLPEKVNTLKEAINYQNAPLIQCEEYILQNVDWNKL